MSAIHWFEIPAADIQRAAQFYGQVLQAEIPLMDMTAQMGTWLGSLPARGGVGGALVQGEAVGYVPGQAGALVYLVVDGTMEAALERVGTAGGQVLLPKTPLGEQAGGGFVAWIVDSEGNQVGLYTKE